MLRLSLYFELHFWKFNALFYFQCSSHLASSISYVLGDWSSVPEAGMWQPADGLLSSCCLHGLLGSLKSLYSRSHSSPCCSAHLFRHLQDGTFPMSGHSFVASVGLQMYAVFQLWFSFWNSRNEEIVFHMLQRWHLINQTAFLGDKEAVWFLRRYLVFLCTW